MSSPDPTRYGRSFADVYDEWYDGLDAGPLLGFLGSRVAAGSTVLELGVGTGRVALPLAAAGYRVIGLDSSPEMLEALAAKDPGATVEPLLADAADPDAYPPADAVVAVFNLLFNLTTEEAQLGCLLGCAASIGDHGVLIVEAAAPDPITERETDLVCRSVTSGKVVLIATETNPADGTIRGGHIEITEDGMTLRPWTARTLSVETLDALAAKAGLELVERFATFGGARFTDDSATHVSTYRSRSLAGAGR